MLVCLFREKSHTFMITAAYSCCRRAKTLMFNVAHHSNVSKVINILDNMLIMKNVQLLDKGHNQKASFLDIILSISEYMLKLIIIVVALNRLESTPHAVLFFVLID
jgi:hypothetical protein